MTEDSNIKEKNVKAFYEEKPAQLSEAALRALYEAEERRKKKIQRPALYLKGEDPTRYGDWVLQGRAIDF